MANGTAGHERELRYHQKQIELSKRWYQAHVRRAETDPDYERSAGQRGSRDGDPGYSAFRFLEFVTGHRPTGSPSQRNALYTELVAEVDDDAGRFERVANWWDEKKPTFLDPVLIDRCAYGFHNPDRVPREIRKSNADAMVAIADYLGLALVAGLTEAAGHELKPWKLPVYWVPTTKSPRPDLWVDWRVAGKDLAEIGLRLWISHKGAAIGVTPGWLGKGWKGKAERVIASTQVDGFREIERSDDTGFYGRQGRIFYGRSYKPDQLSGLRLRSEAERLAADARPILGALIEQARGSGAKPDIPTSKGPNEAPVDPLKEAARDLLVDREFLDDIVELLKDKGQVILYGPPGTGKTFLAQRLARALAPDPKDRALVQFHPSTSYEDFFEGYRPQEGPGGQIVYRLTPGPLARMAERAALHPQRRQVMVIDEINRANLPKALGELLFLLEYRDKSISTLYRPDGEFELPESLWFIGTMNTADRSIALVDAALRRRFHFVPFFPDRGPTEGLLKRWLEKKGQPSWVAELVDRINNELTETLGAELQLGPSHFMKTGYLQEPSPDDKLLRRVWEYTIEPLIEDQFFGNQDQINRFRLGPVLTRYRSSLGLDDMAVAGDGSDEQPSNDG